MLGITFPLSTWLGFSSKFETTTRIFKILNIPITRGSVKTSRKESSHSLSYTPSMPVQMTDNSLVYDSLLHTDWRPDILRQHPTSEDIKLYCVQYMQNETHSFAYTRAVLRELDLGARMEIEKLGGNKGLITILDRLRIETGDEVVVWFRIYLVLGRWVIRVTFFSKNYDSSQDSRRSSLASVIPRVLP